MELKKLKEFKEEILFLMSKLDAVIEDYLGQEKTILRRTLQDTWYKLNVALIDINFEIEHLEKEGRPADQVTAPDPDIDRETFKKLLWHVTPETIREANNAAVFFCKKLEDEKGKKLSKEEQAAFVAVMLFEYGKLTASKKEVAQAADPEVKEGD